MAISSAASTFNGVVAIVALIFTVVVPMAHAADLAPAPVPAPAPATTSDG